MGTFPVELSDGLQYSRRINALTCTRLFNGAAAAAAEVDAEFFEYTGGPVIFGDYFADFAMNGDGSSHDCSF